MNMLVADVMSVRLYCARPETTIKEVARRLIRNRIGGMPVVDADGRIQGIISESDLQPVRDGKTHRPLRTAADAMTRPVVSLTEEDTVTEAARVLVRHGIKRAPVLREGRVVGIVTRSDLLRPYLRADGEIRLDVEEALLQEVAAEGAQVDVAVTDGIVRLEGVVPGRRQAALLVSLAGAVDGVVDVLDRLSVEGGEGNGPDRIEIVTHLDDIAAEPARH